MSETLREGVERLRVELGAIGSHVDPCMTPDAPCACGVAGARSDMVALIDALLAATALTPDESLVEVLNAHQYVPTALRGVSKCSCGEPMNGMPHDHRAHLARAVQGYVEGRVAAGVAELLSGDTARLKVRMALLSRIGPDLGVDKTLATAASAIALEVVREHATGPLTPSTPDGGREGVRGGEGA